MEPAAECIEFPIAFIIKKITALTAKQSEAALEIDSGTGVFP